MGIASYNRGTKVVNAHLPKPSDQAFYRSAAENRADAAEARAKAAEAELARARACIARLRAEKAVLQDELNATREKARGLGADRRRWALAALRAERCWIKASKLLRMLPRHLVEEARATGEHRR